jgi:recombination protein RecR
MTANYVEQLIYVFSRLPGLGPRSARRLVLHLVKNKDTLMYSMSKLIADTASSIKYCQDCFNLDVSSPCGICTSLVRDQNTICIVETVADLWAMDRSNIYKGLFHVLGGSLSAMDKIGPDDLSIQQLEKRISQNNFNEIIIATNATVDGQTTAFYIAEKLKSYNVKITRLAYGLPVGAELDYLDEGTLGAALSARNAIDETS